MSSDDMCCIVNTLKRWEEKKRKEKKRKEKKGKDKKRKEKKRKEKNRMNNRIKGVFEVILKQYGYEATRGGTLFQLFTMIKYLCH